MAFCCVLWAPLFAKERREKDIGILHRWMKRAQHTYRSSAQTFAFHSSIKLPCNYRMDQHEHIHYICMVVYFHTHTRARETRTNLFFVRFNFYMAAARNDCAYNVCIRLIRIRSYRKCLASYFLLNEFSAVIKIGDKTIKVAFIPTNKQAKKDVSDNGHMCNAMCMWILGWSLCTY